MELKNSQIHPSPKGEGLLWRGDKTYEKYVIYDYT